MDDLTTTTLALVDHRRQVADLYHEVRRRGVGAPDTWRWWTARRDELFATHPSTALPQGGRADFTGLTYFDHDPDLAFEVEVEPTEPLTAEIAHSAAGTTTVRRFGRLRFTVADQPVELSVYWLDQYGGGLFLPFRDLTAGDETYGGGRYLLDTAKSADLGQVDGRLVLDFNYSYHPSCFHDPVWSCPLAPPENHLPVPVRAGERRPPDQ